MQGYGLSHEVKGEKVYKFIFHVLDKIQSRTRARYYSTVTRQGKTRRKQGKVRQGATTSRQEEKRKRARAKGIEP